jgi:hypothetical protein
MLLIGDLPSSDDAAAFLAVVNAYETENERFVYGRASIADRLPLAESSSVRRVTSGASLTFAAAGHTITRAAGSWITDGFAVGDVVYVTGSVSNNGTVGVVSAISATVLTFASGVVNEGPISVATVTGRYGLVFAAAGHTITRSAGSWIDDGFDVGHSVVIDGTVSNDGTKTITALTSTVMTFASGLVNETIGIGLGTVTQSLTKAAWMAAQDTEFASIDDEFRIDLSAGRWRVLSPFSSWNFRRPISWFASIREYQHDLHVAIWRKSDGPFLGADMFDEEGNLAEWDDRVDGGAGSAARFTTGRSWANGPVGAFFTLSLTRGRDGSLLSLTHNVAVVNLVQTVTQLNTENAAIGVSLQLNDDGTATRESLSLLAGQVNNALERAVLVDAQGEGPRASGCVWEPSSNDILNVPDATLTGVVQLLLNGTIHDVITHVRVISGGQQ